MQTPFCIVIVSRLLLYRFTYINARSFTTYIYVYIILLIMLFIILYE